MVRKLIFVFLALATIGVFGYGFLKEDKPEAPRPGVAQANNGARHVTSKEYGGDQPPTSGDHAGPVPWGAFDAEVPDVNVIHNMEHGGIYISYRPDLPPEQVRRMKELFFEPFSRDGFRPTKVVLAPRAANKSPIVISSWMRSMELPSVDEEKMVEYYLANFGKSPEPSAL